MYKSFFGLKKNPFNVNPDPAYLYLTPQMRQALDELTYGIETRRGLLLLTGEAGTGKTTLLNHLLLWLVHRRAKTAFIFNSHLDSNQLFDFILSDFDIPATAHSRANPLMAFNEWLLARYRAHDLVVLIVDEAQGLPVHVLEEIRLLQNMETPNEKLLQIVLAGQPELEIKLKRPDLRQLHQRIALRCKTAPLTLPETSAYIEDRLHTAGARDASIFLPEAVEAIHGYSRGIPRVINLLCETALINAYVDQSKTIPPMFVEEAACELQFDDLRPVAPRLRTISRGDQTDLHSVLARIQEDAEAVRVWQETSTLYLVSAQKSGANNGSDICARIPASKVRAMKGSKIAELAASSAGSAVAANGSTVNVMRQPAARTPSKKFPTSFNVAYGAMLGIVEGIAVGARALKLTDKARNLDAYLRTTAKPLSAKISDMAGPKVRIHVAHAKLVIVRGAASAEGWWMRHFREDSYAKSFLASASIAAALYLFARRIDPAQGWQNPGLMIAGFAGLLLCALSITVGVTVLVRARHKLRKDSNVVVTNAMRWLRAPIYPMREFDLSGKIHGARRAS